MNSYLLADQILQFMLNALISFLLFSLFTEGIMRLLQIRNPRFRASFRLIPLLRLSLEPLFWLLPYPLTIINASIFSCSHPLQHFLFGLLSDASKEKLEAYGLKTVTGSYFLMLNTAIIDAAIVILALISIYRMMTLIFQYARSVREIKRISEGGVKSCRPIFSKKLRDRLDKQQTRIIISKEVQVPLAGWKNSIIFPQNLAEDLTQNEFESVISHELEHLIWRDTLTRMFNHLIAVIYWWIPMSRWLNKLENEQEFAGDISVHRYDLEGLDLATALQKTVKMQQVRHYKCAAFAKETTISKGQILIERVKVVLNPSSRLNQNKITATAGMLVMLCLGLILGFVIC